MCRLVESRGAGIGVARPVAARVEEARRVCDEVLFRAHRPMAIIIPVVPCVRTVVKFGWLYRFGWGSECAKGPARRPCSRTGMPPALERFLVQLVVLA